TYKVVPGTVVDDLVSTVDLAPTTLNMLGLDVPEVMQGQAFLGDNLSEPRSYIFGGRDRMDERYDMIRFIRDKQHKLVVNYMPQKSYNQYMNTAEKSPVQQELNRLAKIGRLPEEAIWVIRQTKPVVEFYDLEKDPNELHNLIEDPDSGVLKDEKYIKYFNELMIWAEDIGDLGLIPEPELARLGEKYGYRYHIYDKLEEDSPGFYKTLHSMIPFTLGPRLSDYPNNPALARQYKQMVNHWGGRAMGSASPSVRYWATTGMGQFGRAHPLLVKRLKDRSQLVRIAAAQALIAFENHQEISLNVLVEGLQSDDEWIRLQAATALDESGELARPAIPALKEALNDRENKYVARVANHAVNVLEGTDNQVR
ncbi:MAG: HEAT repeat domain-containing protein, partial [Candidatus Hydrogenedentota bacterium]